MGLNLPKPIIYLITGGETTGTTTPASEGFSRLLNLVEAAVAANVNLIQLREKNLKPVVLYELASQAAGITRGSLTRLLVNDRADVARAAGADGVHLTNRSIKASVIRSTFGDDFLIGASTHTFSEALEARAGGADFAVFGPVFETASKRLYGEALGLGKLEQIASELKPFPILALGGINLDNAIHCLRAGASGIAAIRLLSNVSDLSAVVNAIRQEFSEQQK